MNRSSAPPQNYYSLQEQQRSLKLHQHRVKHVKSTIRFSRSSLNTSYHVKKQPLAELNRLMQIELENKALLKKLTDRTKSAIGHTKPFKLIKNNRKKNIEDREISLENQGLLKRIQDAKSSYQSSTYAEDRKNVERILYSRQKFTRRQKQLKLRKFRHQRGSNICFETDKEQLTKRSALFRHSQCELQKIEQIIKTQSIKIMKKGKKVSGEMKGAIWSQHLSFQICVDKQQWFKLSLTKQSFAKQFHNNLKKFIKSIEYDEQNKSLSINYSNL